MVENKVISIGNVAYVLGMSSKRLHRWYEEVLSGFREAEAAGEIGKDDLIIRQAGVEKRIRVAILKPENMGEHLAVDEKTIDHVCYTVLSNRDTGKIIGMADTLKTEHLAKIFAHLPNCYQVKSLTRDMAANYAWLGHQLFPNAYQVIDKFHVVKNALEYVSDIRVRYRQKELERERLAKEAFELGQKQRKEKCKQNETAYRAIKYKADEVCFANGDTLKQLLARSRWVLFKERAKWTPSQKERAAILFKKYPEIHKAYVLIQELRVWYRKTSPGVYYQKTRQRKQEELKAWIRKAKESDIYEMKNLAHTIDRHSVGIANFFYKSESNAKAEALNSRIQHFIHVNYGARNTDYFMFRLQKHFA